MPKDESAGLPVACPIVAGCILDRQGWAYAPRSSTPRRPFSPSAAHPVLTLWATVVAEHLGYPTETALTLDRAACSAGAWTKARRLRIMNGAQEAAVRQAAAAGFKPSVKTIRPRGGRPGGG